MAPRRGGGYANTLSPQDPAASSGSSSPLSSNFPRSTSPSSGLAQLLAKPTKWFTRSASASKIQNPAPEQPRPSVSSGRKHKISRPTDPRPILDGYAGGASKSVLDLSIRPPGSLDISAPHSTSTPSSPAIGASPSYGTGDLRAISRRGWSKSADDLSQVSPAPFSPIQTSFKEKVAEYRNRSNSSASAMSPASPSSTTVSDARHPFPTVAGNASPSSSPPRSSTMPSVSISISAPAIDDLPQKTTQTQVHTRSHSFTPKQSSKLASPRLSPKRKGSVPTEREVDFNDTERGSPILPPRSTAFPFNFNGPTSTAKQPSPEPFPVPQSPKKSTAHRQTTLLMPPAFPESQSSTSEVGDADSKRSSQIVYHSGFVNRLADVPNLHHHRHHHAPLALSKGWKPFKLELKGSKLHFYKPPSDRSAAAKELFPTELVPPLLEDEDEVEAEVADGEDKEGLGRGQRGREEQPQQQGTYGRKKRAFWGRGTHPDLVRSGGDIEKGTFEALVHEAVFATTFLVAGHEDVQAEGENVVDASKEQQRRAEDWKNFASAILLCLPSIVGQGRFEVEFLRCCAYLVSGAPAGDEEKVRERVGWLAAEYLKCHGVPADLVAWEEWRKETVPDIAAGVVQGSPAPVIAMSSSTQAMLHPSPVVPGSPNIGMFSPRPDEPPQTVSLLSALNAQDAVPPSLSKNASLELRNFEHQSSLRPGGAPNPRMPWAALEQEGLSRDVLLLLDPHLMARGLILFHRSVFEETPENITASFVLGPGNLAPPSTTATIDAPRAAPLFGTEDHPHWLTKLVLLQILGADTSTGTAHQQSSPQPPHQQLASPGRKSEDMRGGSAGGCPQTSRTHSRSEVISVWARIGELCRLVGDECSWRAIAAALCSRPVARLDKAWKRVDRVALAAVESWVYPATGNSELPVGVKEPKVTPWGGDVRARVKQALERAASETGEQSLMVQPCREARGIFEDFRTTFSLCPRRLPIGQGEVNEDVKRMVAFWREMAAERGGVGAMAAKFQQVEQFMSLSLAAEPRRKGLFEPYFWTRSTSGQAPNASLLPLLFPEPLPTVCLIDRAQLLRGRVDSDASDVQLRRAIDPHRHPAQRPLTNDRPDQHAGLAALNQSGTVIPVYNGDLLLVVQAGSGMDSAPNSRPPSSRMSSRPPSSVVDSVTEKGIGRAPSIRVKPGSSAGLERKSSVARRNSLPSLPHRQNFVISETSSEPPLRVMVQAGTLNMLVNILVHGLGNVSVSVADDNGEMSLREGMTRELVVDRVEFAKIWWNVFRSFVSPVVFFELLRKLYITSQPVGSSPPVGEYVHVITARGEVLETIKEWLSVGGGAQDVLDDVQLFNALQSFLDSPSDHIVYEAKNFSAPNVQQSFSRLTEARRTLRSSFISQTMRPLTTRGPAIPRSPVNDGGFRTRNLSMREPPDIDHVDAEDFVDNLDGMACAAFSNVTEEDLYVTADLLEVQSSDRTGWFSLRETSTIEEGVDIQTIYSHIQEVEHSPRISELNQDSLYRMLPPGIRSCVRAYGIIRKWIISKIIAPRLGLRARQARMELLLQAVEVARLRNTTSTSTPAGLVDQPCVRSFVEAVTTSAILSVESRMHSRAWQNLAVTRGVKCDSIAALLSRPATKSVSYQEPLTPDMGWVLERMLEVIATPDTVESVAQDAQNLVNFDKRRHLCNLIDKAPALPSLRRRVQPDEFNRRGFERLNNVEKEVFLLQFDHRGIRDEAAREASQPSMGTPLGRKLSKPFQRLVVAQLEKNRRDRNLRSRLQKEKLQEQSRNDKRDDLLNRAMRPRKQGALTVQKAHRNKKSMSAFLQFMRPISSAFGADIPSSPGVKKTAAELDFVPSGKPSLVLSLVDAQVAQFINNERSYTFKLDTEDGGHYILQAMNRRDMVKWIETISRVTKMAAKRRLTYLGSSPKPQLSDHIHSHPVVASRDPKAVFGVELEFLLQREGGNEPVPPGAVPFVIEQCLSEVEARGLTEVGIYRIAGAVSEINALKDAFNRGESPITSATDIHAVCDLVKTWFRVLPQAVFPPSSYFDVIRAMQLENLDARLAEIRKVVQALPQANFDLLRRVSEHLDRVTDFEEHNQMTAEALAIVFSPNLLRSPQNDFSLILANMGHTHKLVKALITHFHVIFDEADPEADAHSEDEYDSPIMEEDEEEDEDDLHVPQTLESAPISSETDYSKPYTPN
ncbi:putative GTPase-activator protein for Rho-like GTPases [Lyophyllum shimeji]|uniref:GTPase-activator protein for Rho-like GTPases n=1 Tax=Lyophyllum shimeji TaxID=47721 RepID=A0A9P3UP61_LYOSH|nr:putative GTPase-activator protein for Rho-like GTPases [Lyophyllum shimeji]